MATLLLLAVTKVEVLSATAFGVSFVGIDEKEVPSKPEIVKAVSEIRRLNLLTAIIIINY